MRLELALHCCPLHHIGLSPDNGIAIMSIICSYTILSWWYLVLIKAHLPLHHTVQVLLSVTSLIDQIETESYTVQKEAEIDPVACLIHLLALLMEVMRNMCLTPNYIPPLPTSPSPCPPLPPPKHMQIDTCIFAHAHGHTQHTYKKDTHDYS